MIPKELDIIYKHGPFQKHAADILRKGVRQVEQTGAGVLLVKVAPGGEARVRRPRVQLRDALGHNAGEGGRHRAHTERPLQQERWQHCTVPTDNSDTVSSVRPLT